MKKCMVFCLVIGLVVVLPANAQVSKFIRNVKNNVAKDILNSPGKTSGSSKTLPEPSCACETADVMIDLSKFSINYTESTISILEDGSILVDDKMNETYYVANNGVTEGPFKKDDPKVFRFQSMIVGSDNHVSFYDRYKQYISKTGDKFLISFGGKSYGPYGQINNFVVSHSGDKFAAMVVQTVVNTEAESKKMEAEINKAGSDEEKMKIAMKYSQLMQQRMMEGGGANGILPKLVSNLPVPTGDNASLQSSIFYNNIKYDDIFFAVGGQITDLQGKKVLDLSTAQCNPDNLFIKSDNSGYACYNYGSITFSDGRKLTDLFNPHLEKADGKIYLAYLYYSPKNNAIMQCKVLF